MTQIERDIDPVENVIGRATFRPRRAEGVIEAARYDPSKGPIDGIQGVPVRVEAKRNGHGNLVLTTYAWLDCNVTQYYEGPMALCEAFEELVSGYDLERVEEFTDVEELEAAAGGGASA